MLDYIIDSALYLIVILVLFFGMKKFFHSITIYEYERGVKFYKGKFKEIVESGKYTYFSPSTRIEVYDMRPAILQINGQEILSADHVNVKISMAIKYQILDPKVIVSEYRDFQENLYMNVQLKLREVMSTLEMDQVLANRQHINDKVKNLLLEGQSLNGLSILSVDVKDIMLSAELKKVYTEVVRAKKEGLAALEKARGESATLRSLANSAKMLANNPELAQLRLIQTIETSKGNTFIINASNSGAEKNQ